MLKNYFTIAVRNLRRNKLFSLINISGLAIGISAALVIYLIVQHEFSVDKFHKDGDSIYRVVSRMQFPGSVFNNSGVPVPVAKAAREEVSGLQNVTHFILSDAPKVTLPGTGKMPAPTFKKQEDIIYADPEYFQILTYEWLAGSPATALDKPFQVVLSANRAKAYFGDAKPAEIIGKQIIYDDSITATVTGVVRDFDKATDFTFEEFISRATLENTGLKNRWAWDQWGSINSGSQMLVKLAKGTKPEQIEKQLVTLRHKYAPEYDDNSPKDGKEKKENTQHFLQPLKDIHFNALYDAFNHRQGHMPTLYGLLAVATFLLLLGCINFINLTTAYASQRAKEIGIRKTLGSSKGKLIGQFLSETFLLTLLATIVSILIAPWLLNVFKDFIPKGISFSSLNQPHVWLFLLALIVLVSVLSGFYPALVLTKFKPVTVLKNQASAGSGQSRKAWLRKTLTVTQFVIAQFLITATLVVSKQIHFSINKELGYKKDAIVYFNTNWKYFGKDKDRQQVLENKLLAIPEIQAVSVAGTSPASNSTSSSTITFEDGKKKVELMVEVKNADSSYFGLYQMKLVAGRNLKQSDTTQEYVINETYAKLLGFTNPKDAVGHYLKNGITIPIVGVLADFNTKSTRSAIQPLAFASQRANANTFHIALKPRGNNPDLWKNGLAKVEKTYKSIYPEDDFEYKFYDETIAKFYTTEQNISRLLNWAAGLCVLISCLGLLGLVIYTTNTRTKEIGVRKVLGASVASLVSLLSKDFVVLVLVAFLIAAPLAGWAMYNWLQDFAYRTNMSWWIFALCGGGMVLIALITLGTQTIRSATANPVKSLRTE
jgi:putative ABC transport system permease protein